MLLENRYYRLHDMHTGGTPDKRQGRFRIGLIPECDIYRGHFPGNPVAPGVCNIQVVKECTERLTGERALHLTSLQQCRLTAVVTPGACPELDVHVEAARTEDGAGYKVAARISDERQTYMELKGVMTV